MKFYFKILKNYTEEHKRIWFTFHRGFSGLIYLSIYKFRIAFNWKINIARILFWLRIKPKYHSEYYNLAPHLITVRGYGKLSKYGKFYFQLPD